MQETLEVSKLNVFLVPVISKKKQYTICVGAVLLWGLVIWRRKKGKAMYQTGRSIRPGEHLPQIPINQVEIQGA